MTDDRWRAVLRTRGGSAVRLLLGVLLAAAAVLVTASPAAAHASLLSTDPDEGAILAEAPEVLTLTFDEPVRLPEGGARLLDPTGAEVAVAARTVDDRMSVVPGELGEGTHVLAWRVISADGHPVAGALTFSVGRVSEAPPLTEATGAGPVLETALGVVAGLVYLGLLLSAGLRIFDVLVLRRSGGGVRRVAGWSTAVAVVAALALVAVTVAHQAGVWTALGRPASWEPALLGDSGLQVALLVAGLGIAAAAHRSSAAWAPAAVLLGAAMALAAPSLAGHTRGYGPAPLMVAADAVHLITAAVWLGGLVPSPTAIDTCVCVAWSCGSPEGSCPKWPASWSLCASPCVVVPHPASTMAAANAGRTTAVRREGPARARRSSMFLTVTRRRGGPCPRL